MTIHEAYNILRRSMDFYMGYDRRDGSETGITQARVYEALDMILREAGHSDPTITCHTCQHCREAVVNGTNVFVCSKMEIGICTKYEPKER